MKYTKEIMICQVPAILNKYTLYTYKGKRHDLNKLA